MAAPTPYVPQYNFTNFQTANPSTPLPADKLDSELFDVKITTDQLITNLSQIQRSDNQLQNAVVTPDSLNSAVLILMGNFNPRGAWLTTTVYAARDVVSQTTGTYVCNTAHTSGVFATDLAAGKWTLIAGSSGTVALASLTDVTITTPVTNQLLSYNGTKWVNTTLALANIPDGLLTFAKLNSAVFSTDGTFASADDLTLPTTKAVKTFVRNSGAGATGADVVAATTTSLTGAFDYVHVTGNTTINAITLAANESKWVLFTGTPQITHNGTSLILPGAANIVAAANDRALFRGIDGVNVICEVYVRANGQPVALPTATAAVLGAASPDNTTITATAGVFKVATATPSQLGASSPDNTTITATAGVYKVAAAGLVSTPLAVGSIIMGVHAASTIAAGATAAAATITAKNCVLIGASTGVDPTLDTLAGTWQAMQSQPTANATYYTNSLFPFQRTL